MSTQNQTVRLTSRTREGNETPADTPGVVIVALGERRDVPAGLTVREALLASQLPFPGPQQSVRRNLREVDNLDEMLEQGDTLTITNRVIGGGAGLAER